MRRLPFFLTTWAKSKFENSKMTNDYNSEKLK